MAQSVSSNSIAGERLCQIITPVGMLGYGFIDDHVEAGLESMKNHSTPTAIILDSGSTDSGPSKLALGTMSCPKSSYERDIRKLIKLGRKYKVPILIGSAGGDGADEHVDALLDIIRELAEEPENRSWNLKVLAIYAGINHDLVSERLKAGDIVGCGPCVPTLTQKDIDQTIRIVAQMGSEPFLDAMIANPDFDIVIGGRAYDPVPYIAFCAYHALNKGMDSTAKLQSLPKEMLGAFAHMGKLMECGGACATPKSNSAAINMYRSGTFDISPLDPVASCTPRTVAAHSLYENSRPDILYGPGGYMDLTKTTYQQLEDGRSVSVRGCVFVSSAIQGKPYTVKLEGARVMGYRTLFIGTVRDPILISQLEKVFARIKEYVKEQHKHIKEFYDVDFHVYGLDAERKTSSTNGVFVVGESIAESQRLATSVASTARIGCIHASYPGQRATAGNLGFGFGGKFEFEVSECAEFSLYHLMSLRAGEAGAIQRLPIENGVGDGKRGAAIFRWTSITIGKADGEETNSESQTNGIVKDENRVSVPSEQLPFTSPLRKLPDRPRSLGDVASIVRSKNAGPYEITIDVLFDSAPLYELIRSADLLTPDTIADNYNISLDDIIWCGFFEPALAFKVTIPRRRNGRRVAAGGFLENDVHGSQHHVPLLELGLGKELVEKIQSLTRESSVS